jgi:hypothetical protein
MILPLAHSALFVRFFGPSQGRAAFVLVIGAKHNRLEM